MGNSYRPWAEELEVRELLANYSPLPLPSIFGRHAPAVVAPPPPAPSLEVSQNTGYTSQTALPNTVGVEIGSFVVHNTSASRALRLTNLLVGLSGTENFSNLASLKTSVTSGMGTVPVLPMTSNVFVVNEVLAPGASRIINIFADSGTQTGVTAITSLAVSYVGVTAFTSSKVVGQTITFANARLNAPTLVVPASSVSQYIASANGATNATRATYNLPAVGGSVVIRELKFATVADNQFAVTSVRVGSVTAPVVNGVAHLTGLNLTVPAGGAGLNVDALVSYASVGVNGIPSGTKVAIGMSYAKYVTAGTTQIANFSPAIMAPTMTLVGSKPTVGLSLPVNLTIGTMRVANVTIAASFQGDVKVNQIPFVFVGNAAGTHINPSTALVVRDSMGVVVANAVVSNVTGNGTSFTTALVTFTNGYLVPAGQSQTFAIEVAWSALAGTARDSISTSISPADSFIWTDLAGQGISGAESGKLIYGFPTNSVTILK